MIDWRELADDILRRLNAQGRSISSMHKQLGISRATMHRLASGKPVEAATYLAVCKWLGYSPFLYFKEHSNGK